MDGLAVCENIGTWTSSRKFKVCVVPPKAPDTEAPSCSSQEVDEQLLSEISPVPSRFMLGALCANAADGLKIAANRQIAKKYR